MPVTPEQLRQRLWNAMKLNGDMKAIELSRASGVQHPLISPILSGKSKKPTWDTIVRFQEVLGVDLSKPLPEEIDINEYVLSDYAKDDKPSDEELAELRLAGARAGWENMPPKAWSLMLHAIRVYKDENRKEK
jgi:transcriptional regulator with XRE-family HTH domain